MTKEQLEQGKKLQISLCKLNTLWHILHIPYPRIFSNSRWLRMQMYKHTRFADNTDEVCFYDLDEKTREELRTAMKDIISRRMEEVKTELKEL